MNIGDILKNRLEQPVVTEKSERNSLNKQIDELHKSPHERIMRKKENWKRYITFLKSIKSGDTKENQSLFKKSPTFLKEHNSLWFFTSHIKTKDLYYVLSQMKDAINRGKSASAWFFDSRKVK